MEMLNFHILNKCIQINKKKTFDQQWEKPTHWKKVEQDSIEQGAYL